MYLVGIMPPTRGGPERNVETEELRLELKCIQVKMEFMEIAQRREPDTWDVKESEYTSYYEE